jgi:hypothetical protein
MQRSNTAGALDVDQAVREAQFDRESGRPSLRDSLVVPVAGFLTKVAVRAAQNYTAHCLEQWIARRPVVTSASAPDSTPAEAPPAVDGRSRPPDPLPGRPNTL